MSWLLPAGDTYFAPYLREHPEGFEIDHLCEALKFCKNWRVAIDGGAHIGTWTRHLASLFRVVYAFEPAPDTYACLGQNTADLTNVITLQQALGAWPGFGVVEEDPTRQGNTGSRIVTPTIIDAPTPKRTVMFETVDDLNFTDLDFLKLDVEGHEYPALLGAERTIARCQPTLVVECKQFNPPRNGGPERVLKLLDFWNYQMVGGIRNDKVFVPR